MRKSFPWNFHWIFSLHMWSIIEVSSCYVCTWKKQKKNIHWFLIRINIHNTKHEFIEMFSNCKKKLFISSCSCMSWSFCISWQIIRAKSFVACWKLFIYIIFFLFWDLLIDNRDLIRITQKKIDFHFYWNAAPKSLYRFFCL